MSQRINSYRLERRQSTPKVIFGVKPIVYIWLFKPIINLKVVYKSMKILKLLLTLIHSNIFISLAAVSFTVETQIQLGMEPQWHPYLFIIFFATLFEYNLHRLITIINDRNAVNTQKHGWIKTYPKLFYLLVVVSIIGFLFTVFLANKEVLIILSPFAVLTLFYSLPIFKKAGILFRLREIPLLKIILISFVWSSVTIMLPLIQSTIEYQSSHIILMLIERFIFVFAITIPFDIRDFEIDKKAGLKTIPIIIGTKWSISLSRGLILIFMFICLLHYNTTGMRFIFISLIISGISTLYFIDSKKLQRLSYYHYGILDGTMLLQGLLVLILHCVYK